MLRIYLVAFCAWKIVAGAKVPSPTDENAPVFRDECKDPKLNDCPLNSICVDQFYGFVCQCKPGFTDKSPDVKQNPGRICVASSDAGSEVAPENREATTPISVTKAKSHRRTHSAKTTGKTEPVKEDITKSPLIDQVARDPNPEREQKAPEKEKEKEKAKPKESEAGKAALRDTFNAFDSSKDGQINFTELRAATRNNKLNLADADVKLMLKTADKNNDGVVSFDEFQTLMKGRRSSS